MVKASCYTKFLHPRFGELAAGFSSNYGFYAEIPDLMAPGGEKRRTHVRGYRYLKKERAPLFRDALSHCLPRRCRFGEAPIPLQTRVDNRRRVADFQSRPVIKPRTTQPPWD